MSGVSDVLTVSFDSGLKDKSVLCVTRTYMGKTTILKMELGEQADILYYLLTGQMVKLSDILYYLLTKPEIKVESEVVE